MGVWPAVGVWLAVGVWPAVMGAGDWAELIGPPPVVPSAALPVGLVPSAAGAAGRLADGAGWLTTADVACVGDVGAGADGSACADPAWLRVVEGTT